jgi:uncharacterized protein
MPVTTTYPGIYINELQSSAHTITAAPTSIAVFIGYTHPFKTLAFGQAVQLFSFTDYEQNFGGFFSNAVFHDPTDFGCMALAVNQFFLNGGAQCYVVGLQATVQGATPASVQPATPTVGGVQFTALEPTDANHVMTIRLDNGTPPGANPTIADITMTYGSGPGARVEKFRQVSLVAPTATNPNPNYITTRIGMPGLGNQVSTLVTVSPNGLPGHFSLPSVLNGQNFDQSGSGGTAAVPDEPPDGSKIFSVADFTGTTGVFQANQSLDKVPVFNLLNLPGITDPGILGAAAAFCERKLAFMIIDPPYTSAADAFGGKTTEGQATTPIATALNNTFFPPVDKNAALYFPYLVSTDPVSGATIEIPPGATVAGVYGNTDQNRGVWKAPAGLQTSVLNAEGVVMRGLMTDQQQGVLNALGVNCLREFAGSGTVIFGARTMATADPAQQSMWRYVPVRRMALFLEQTLYNNLGWVVFEPNDEPLWTSIRISISAFMLGLFRQRAFQGDKPSDAFQVKCDSQTTTQADIDNGIVNIVVAFAPLKPAEFVIVNIAQLAGQASS